ncbi:hypothetical protein TRIUR3_06093 [Triticum urartu]|uniref:Uncharacterized protein n=1 Tax=Triticum urartu TaxID=4572 RepID=M8A7T6_TRIUA|nr:hypothetical protein TRIUR3_06093 [Triticum urartu]
MMPNRVRKPNRMLAWARRDDGMVLKPWRRSILAPHLVLLRDLGQYSFILISLLEAVVATATSHINQPPPSHINEGERIGGAARRERVGGGEIACGGRRGKAAEAIFLPGGGVISGRQA